MSNYLPAGLQQSLLEHLLRHLNFVDDKVFQFFHRDENPRLLRYLLENGFIERDDFSAYVHEQLMKIGRGLYDYHIKSETPPDHLGSCHVLGYWLRNDGFEKLPFLGRKQICFDHGETREKYEQMAEGLLGNVVGQLLAVPVTSSEVPEEVKEEHF